MMLSRRDVLQAPVAATVLAANMPSIAQTARSDEFSIDAAFAEFMQNMGGTPHDGGGSVTFAGRDPIVRSRFRTGACMAIPAMGAGVGAAAIWRERTGQSRHAARAVGHQQQRLVRRARRRGGYGRDHCEHDDSERAHRVVERGTGRYLEYFRLDLRARYSGC